MMRYHDEMMYQIKQRQKGLTYFKNNAVVMNNLTMTALENLPNNGNHCVNAMNGFVGIL